MSNRTQSRWRRQADDWLGSLWAWMSHREWCLARWWPHFLCETQRCGDLEDDGRSDLPLHHLLPSYHWSDHHSDCHSMWNIQTLNSIENIIKDTKIQILIKKTFTNIIISICFLCVINVICVLFIRSTTSAFLTTFSKQHPNPFLRVSIWEKLIF